MFKRTRLYAALLGAFGSTVVSLLDLQAQYSGIFGWEFTAGIKNALDRSPP